MTALPFQDPGLRMTSSDLRHILGGLVSLCLHRGAGDSACATWGREDYDRVVSQTRAASLPFIVPHIGRNRQT